jgi:protocatechuate 3,4-dioxygenase beta subunit
MADISLNEKNSGELVADRLTRNGNGALPRFLSSLAAHLHAAVRESRPSGEDWRHAIAFLTDVGHASDERRQEWVLLSDLLGITALIEELNSRRPPGATPNTVRGPFYRPDAPLLPLGTTISRDGKGETLRVRGHVRDLDGDPIGGATIDTWQANQDGLYENQQPDLQPEFNLRGKFITDAKGRFHYETVRPRGYAVPEDGPVGRMLGAIGYPLRRPAHLHFIVKAAGFETISTHVFDASDPNIAEDALFGVKPELLGRFERQSGAWTLDFDFVMIRAKPQRRAA